MNNKSLDQKPKRLYDLDWMRVIGVVAVFIFHVSHYFDFEYWHVKNNVISESISYFGFFFLIWAIPLLFIISGISSNIILSFQKPGRFLKSRVFRILIPFVFGMFVFGYLQSYMEFVYYERFSGSFFEFAPTFFNFTNFPFNGFHLWFLILLFIFSLILLIIFLLSKRKNEFKSISKFFSKPGTLFILTIPLAITEWVVPFYGFGGRIYGGWGILTFLILFLFGYYIFSSASVREATEKQRFYALGIFIVSYGIWGFFLFSGMDFTSISLNYFLYHFIRVLCMLSILLTIIGFANRKLKFTNRFLSYSNEAALPFYILHQPVILVIGFFIFSWTWYPWLKWIFLLVTSFIVIMLVYHFIVRPFNPVRFLFGMKLKKKISKK
jgi:peptidoglycan/LPS O-acetylase OafA/YrhL